MSTNRNRIIIMTIMALAFVVLATLVITEKIQGFNHWFYTILSAAATPTLTGILTVITHMGAWFVYVPVCALLLIMPRSRIKVGIPAAAVAAVSSILNLALKYSFRIDRPDVLRLVEEHGYGFPSGHAMSGVAFVGICAYLFGQSGYKKGWKIAVFIVSATFLILLGLSRIYLGVHTASDVLGGYLCGLAILYGTIIIINWKESAHEKDNKSEV